MLSFAISRPALAFWWATLWRYLLWLLAFLIPMVILIFILQLAEALLLGSLSFFGLPPAVLIILKLLFSILNIVIQNFIIPVALTGFVLSRMFKKGRFGSYAISGTYNGQPANTLKSSLDLAFWYYLEILKYLWPLFLVGIFIGLSFKMQKNDATLGLIVLLSIPGLFYLHWLVLTDILRRRQFKHFSLEIDRI
jgi:hypothetical protein